MNDLINDVELWAMERDLHVANPYKQILKVVEEVGEISGALARKNLNEVRVEIGDGMVTLIILAMQLDMDIKKCLELAYKKIENRRGKTINGIYVKEEDLPQTNSNQEINKGYVSEYIKDMRKDINHVIKTSHDDEARKELRRINRELLVVVKGLSE